MSRASQWQPTACLICRRTFEPRGPGARWCPECRTQSRGLRRALSALEREGRLPGLTPEQRGMLIRMAQAEGARDGAGFRAWLEEKRAAYQEPRS